MRDLSTKQLHAARVLSDLRRGGSKDWWDRFAEVEEYYQTNGNFDGLAYHLRSWFDNVRTTYRDGRLKNSQIIALRKINFPFNVTKDQPRTHSTRSKGKRLDTIVDLFNRKERGEDLSPQDQQALQKGLNHYRTAYNGGSLSETAAKKLGIL